MNNKLTCFKAYDVRGRLGVELNETIAYAIARAYAIVLKPSKLVIGSDIRLSSPSLKQALILGLTDSGVDVIDLGLTGTEEIYFATKYLKVDGGIEVTASHNPKDYNGMKFVGYDSVPIGPENGLLEIKQLAEKLLESSSLKADNSTKGTCTFKNLQNEYIDKIFSFINPKEIKPLRLVVNAGNGAAGPIVDKIEQYVQKNKLPLEFIKINNEPNGIFPKGVPNPLLIENRFETSRAVFEHKADMGIAWDGDFDRCFLFDETGTFIQAYYIVGLLSEAFLASHQKSKIIHDPRLTWNSIDIINKAGGQAIQSKTGHAYIKEMMRKQDAIYGGEMSGHHYFRDFAYCDSGMIPWLLICELMSLKDQSLSSLVKERITLFPSSGELNFTIENKKELIEKVKNIYSHEALKIESLDGISMEFNNWRFNLRCSNTEPLVRLNVESRNDINLLTEKTNEICQLIKMSGALK